MGPAGGLIVELVGLPAAGKSRVARELRGSLRDRFDAAPGASPSVTTSSGKRAPLSGPTAARRILSTTVRSPGKAIAAARALHASDQNSHTKAARLFLYHQYLRAELRQARRSDELHLADQGVLQHLRRVHLTAGADGTDYLWALASTCYPPLDPDLVVFVDVDHETRMARAADRGTDVDEALLDPEHPAIQDDHESYDDLKELVPLLADEFGLAVRTMTIDNRDDNLKENVDHIVAAIAAIRERDDDQEGDRPSSRYRALGAAR